jgi:hypothetical protein
LVCVRGVVGCWFRCFLRPCLVPRNQTRLEETSEPTPHGDQKLHVQQYEAPDDGHHGARNMSSSV